MKLIELLSFDKEIAKTSKSFYFIGIDEVGRGALAGPVIACAFLWKNMDRFASNKTFINKMSKLNDSKQLSSREREKLFQQLIKYGEYSLGYGSIKEIEKLNILNATFLAMKRAYESLLTKLDLTNDKTYVLVDGNKFNPFINCRQLPLIDGDTKSSLIAAASVVAKVYRDEIMQRIARLKNCRVFGWKKNVGYGTYKHRRAIKKHGVTPFHRKKFVEKALELK